MTTTQSFFEFVDRVMDACPLAIFGTDNEGQIIIYTNLCETEDGMVVPLDEPNLTGV